MPKKQHSVAATAMIKLGNSDWTPACDEHVEKARAKSAAREGSGKPLKGQDTFPVQVRPLTETEKASKPRCSTSALGI